MSGFFLNLGLLVINRERVFTTSFNESLIFLRSFFLFTRRARTIFLVKHLCVFFHLFLSSMVKQKEVLVPDIYPVIARDVRFVNEEWNSLSGFRYSLRGEEYETNESGYIDAKNIRKDDTIKVLFETEMEFDESQFIEEIQTEVSKLMLFGILVNKAEGGKGPLKTGDDRSEYVTIVQKMLSALGYYLGESGDKKDGVDGVFGDWTRNAVLSFQSLSTDEKTGEPLKIDGLVGPVTIEVLARECVREGILKFYVTRESQDENMELIWSAHRGTYQNHELEFKDVIEFTEDMEKELEEL